jgi:hypothetical protein
MAATTGEQSSPSQNHLYRSPCSLPPRNIPILKSFHCIFEVGRNLASHTSIARRDELERSDLSSNLQPSNLRSPNPRSFEPDEVRWTKNLDGLVSFLHTLQNNNVFP